MSDVKFEIVRRIAVISDKGSGWTREINLVRWNDGGLKVDIRDWNSGRQSMRKGLTFNRPEFLSIVKAFKKINADDLYDPFMSLKEATVEASEADDSSELDAVVNG
ncbi:MAG: hypothetical protein IJS71_01335 [Clostridia bacterium]|nr:hypothetical protein [Clostridia bacterium]